MLALEKALAEQCTKTEDAQREQETADAQRREMATEVESQKNAAKLQHDELQAVANTLKRELKEAQSQASEQVCSVFFVLLPTLPLHCKKHLVLTFRSRTGKRSRRVDEEEQPAD